MKNAMKFEFEKFKSLVHYVCEKASGKSSVLGAIKLNKVLWYSDVVAYKVLGRSITGEVYVKRQYGPVPKHVLSAIDALVADGKIARGKVDHFGFVKNEYIAIEDCSVSQFSADEIKLIDEAFEHVCVNHTARSVSEETHDIIWQIAQMGEVMPYEAVFASTAGEIDETDLAWANKELVAA